jgi:hypothetical protein
MSNLTSSIVKGFGFTLGRKAANSLIDSSSKNQVYKYSEIDCWSHKGYEENDVEILYDYDYLRKQIKWYAWIMFLIPIVNLFKSIPYFYNVFIKKNKIYYYDMKWESFKISDGRVKGGIKEVKKLKPELSKVEVYPPYTRNKVESVIALSISLLLSSPIFIGIYLSIK